MSRSRNRYHQRNKRRKRRFKSFNPIHVVKKAAKQQDQPEYQAQHKFVDFAIDNQIKNNILNRGFSTPTPIQDQIIPHILKNRDVVGLANTGTGKTAAFLIPLINNLIQNPSKKVLIMTPTRELAIQIRKEFKIFAQGLNIKATLCIGGTSIKRQISALKQNPDFVIGTPGRLIDLTQRRKLKLNLFSAVVLDEADEMLNMGFINDMKFIIGRMPKNKQTLFFSATLPDKLNSVIKKFVQNPIKVEVKTRETAANVEQKIVKINGRSKTLILQSLLKKDGFDKVLVFGRTKHGLNKLSRKLDKKGFNVAIIHGNKSQNQRRKAMKKFKNNHVQALLATDVASRGLDINDITHVINYDLPESYEVYIHRIGRTGRADKTGIALSFVE